MFDLNDIIAMQRRKAWLVFAAISILSIGTHLAYLEWRERSLEPLSASIDLTQPGSYTFAVKGFHASEYHPEFNLQLPFPTDIHNWFSDDGYRQLWGDSPPKVHIDVVDQDGHTVLRETSTLTRRDDWIVTGSPPAPWVEVYKLSEFEAKMFGSYTVTLTVVTGSPDAARYLPRFEVAAVQAYALLPATLGFILLLVGLALSAVVIGVVQFVNARRSRRAGGMSAN